MLIPIHQIFRTVGGMSLLVWLCLLSAIWFFVRGKIRANGTLIWLILLLNYFITRMQMNISDFVLCFGQMFILYVLLPKQDAESAERTTKAFCWSLTMTSLYALIFRSSPQLVAILGVESPAIFGMTIMRFAGLIGDPNYYMTLLIVGLAVLCKLKETGRLHNVRFWCLGIAMTAFGILTYSKTFFLVFILLAGIYIIWQFWNRRVFKGVFFASLAVVGGLYMIFSENSPFAVVMLRLTDSDSLSDITTGRSDLLVIYWESITESISTLLFGKGLSVLPIQGRGAHNLFLEMIYLVGVVGLFLVLCFYCSMVRDIIKENPKIRGQSASAKYAVLLIMMVQYCALQGAFLLVMYAGWFMAFISIKITPKESGQ
jgi:O-antigen ligase